MSMITEVETVPVPAPDSGRGARPPGRGHAPPAMMPGNDGPSRPAEGVRPTSKRAPRPRTESHAPRAAARAVDAPQKVDHEDEFWSKAREMASGPITDILHRELASIAGQIASAPGYMNWGSMVRRHVERRSRVDAALLRLGLPMSGQSFTGPDPDAVDDQAGRIVFQLALESAGLDLAGMLRRVEQTMPGLSSEADQAARAAEDIFRTLGGMSGVALLDAPARYAARRAEADALSRRLAQSRELLDGFPAALAGVLPKIVADFIGVDELVMALVEVAMVTESARPTDPDEAELARVAARLKAMGMAPNSENPGRIAAGLQQRHAELIAIIDRKRLDARQRLSASTTATVKAAMAGDVGAWDAIHRATETTPEAFPDDFPTMWVAVLQKALEGLPAAPLAYILLGPRG